MITDEQAAASSLLFAVGCLTLAARDTVRSTYTMTLAAERIEGMAALGSMLLSIEAQLQHATEEARRMERQVREG